MATSKEQVKVVLELADGIVYLCDRLGKVRALEYLSDGVNRLERLGDRCYRLTEEAGVPQVLLYHVDNGAADTAPIGRFPLTSPGRWLLTRSGVKKLRDFRREQHRVKRVLLAVNVPVNEVLHMVNSADEVRAQQSCVPGAKIRHSPDWQWLILYTPWGNDVATIHRVIVNSSMREKAHREFGDAVAEIVFGRGADAEYLEILDSTLPEALAWATAKFVYRIHIHAHRHQRSYVRLQTDAERAAVTPHFSEFCDYEETRALGYLMARWGASSMNGENVRRKNPAWSLALRDPVWAWEKFRRIATATRIGPDSAIQCRVQLREGYGDRSERIYTPNWREEWPELAGQSLGSLNGNPWTGAFTLLDVPSALSFILGSTEEIDRKSMTQSDSPFRTFETIRLNEQQVWEGVREGGTHELLGRWAAWTLVPVSAIGSNQVSYLTSKSYDISNADVVAALHWGNEAVFARNAVVAGQGTGPALLIRQTLNSVLLRDNNYVLRYRSREDGSEFMVSTRYHTGFDSSRRYHVFEPTEVMRQTS